MATEALYPVSMVFGDVRTEYVIPRFTPLNRFAISRAFTFPHNSGRRFNRMTDLARQLRKAVAGAAEPQ